MIDELERANRVRDPFDEVALAMCPVVHRIDAPRVARAVVVCVPDAIEHGVPHLDVRVGHVALRAQDVRAVGELASPHAAEEVEVLGGRPRAERAVDADAVEIAARLADLVERAAVDVGLAALDHADREVVELLEIVAREEQVRAPVEAEPLHARLDRVDELLLLLLRVRVVEAQVAAAVVVVRDAEIQADRLRVADVQIAVRFGGSA